MAIKSIELREVSDVLMFISPDANDMAYISVWLPAIGRIDIGGHYSMLFAQGYNRKCIYTKDLIIR